MTETEKYHRETKEVARFELLPGVFLLQTIEEYGYPSKGISSYNSHDLEGLGATEIEQLSTLAKLLQNLPESGALDFEESELEEFLKEWASETAEEAELPFTFTNSHGKTETYTPASLWEASGSCSEWEESAQYGYDYGWNI